MFSLLIIKLSAEISYGVVVDAGSTGTRTFIYQWDSEEEYPNVQPAPNAFSPWSLSFDIPLAMAEFDEYTVPNIFNRVLEFVKPKVERSNTETPIYVYATGGMRLIPIKAQERIVKETHQFIEHHSNLKLRNDAVKIITGSEEGYFGWIAVNHLYQTFVHGQPSIGALDFGGASSQIAAQTPENGDNIIKSNFNNSEHNVFSHSFLGFGINELMDEVQNFLRSQTRNLTVINPCQFSHHLENRDNVTFVGGGNYKECFNVINSLFISSKKFQNVSIPKLTSNVYHGLGGFSYFNSFVGLPDNSTFSQTKEKSINLCNQKWEDVKSKDPDNTHIWQYCLSGAFQEALLTKGFHFTDNNVTFIKSPSINGVNVSWTLGALLDGLLTIQKNGSAHFQTVYIVLIIIVTLLVVCAITFVVLRFVKHKKDEETAYEALNSTSLLGPW